MSEPKTYSLKPIEQQMIRIILQQQSALLSNQLSFFAIERLAIPVDENTRFELNPEQTEMIISQVEPEQPPEDAGIVTEAPKKGKK